MDVKDVYAAKAHPTSSCHYYHICYYYSTLIHDLSYLLNLLTNSCVVNKNCNLKKKLLLN